MSGISYFYLLIISYFLSLIRSDNFLIFLTLSSLEHSVVHMCMPEPKLGLSCWFLPCFAWDVLSNADCVAIISPNTSSTYASDVVVVWYGMWNLRFKKLFGEPVFERPLSDGSGLSMSGSFRCFNPYFGRVIISWFMMHGFYLSWSDNCLALGLLIGNWDSEVSRRCIYF